MTTGGRLETRWCADDHARSDRWKEGWQDKDTAGCGHSKQRPCEPVASEQEQDAGRAWKGRVEAEALRRVERWLARRQERLLTRDERGQLLAVTEADGTEVSYQYDDHGDLIRICEADGRKTDYRYDERRRLTQVTYPDGEATHYCYDDGDRLTGIDDRGTVHRFEYDSQSRLMCCRQGASGASVYRYDVQGRVTEARTSAVSTCFDYDTEDRVIGIHQTIDGVTLSLRRSFDAAGRLEALWLPGGATPVRYAWDEKGRPEKIAFGGMPVAWFAYDEAEMTTRVRHANGCIEEIQADPIDRRTIQRRVSCKSTTLFQRDYVYDLDGRIRSDGAHGYSYDAVGRLNTACSESVYKKLDVTPSAPDSGRTDRCTTPKLPQDWRSGGDHCIHSEEDESYDVHGRCIRKRDASGEWTYRYNDADQLTEVRRQGALIAEFLYDHKGRLAQAKLKGRTERYLYGPADELLAVTDAQGKPLRRLLRTPFGLLAEIQGERELFYRHHDHRGTCHLVTDAQGEVAARFTYAPFGAPISEESASGDIAPIFDGRTWHAEIGLYYFGARWYDPETHRFLTPDTYTGGPDDARLVHPCGPASGQVERRAQILAAWLEQPYVRDPYAYCGGDPVNNSDPNGHWSFGGVLLSILGAIWTLPNTIFGLFLEILCLVGEVIRWLVWLITAGNVSWETPGFDVASSGRLNAFALVFTGGLLGSFSSLLGITFGNVFFVYKQWPSKPSLSAPGNVSPSAYKGAVSFPRSEALYEHELRHTNQYGWFGPFFHLGLPVFGFYEWDVILHGYSNAWTERDARAYGGI